MVLDESTSLMRADGTLYTVAMKAKSNQPTANKGKLSFWAASSGGNLMSIYLKNIPIITDEYKQSVFICSEAQGGSVQPTFCINLEPPFEIGVPYYIDVTIKDLRLFEGAYVNPPSGRSIDRAETKFPMFVTTDLRYNADLEYRGFPVQRIRRLDIPNSDTAPHNKFYYMMSNSNLNVNGASQIFVADLWECPGVQYEGNKFRRFRIKCFAVKYAGTITSYEKSITLMDDWTMIHHASETSYQNCTINYSIKERTIGNYHRFFLYGEATNHLPGTVQLFLQPRCIRDNNVPMGSEYPHFQGVPVEWDKTL